MNGRDLIIWVGIAALIGVLFWTAGHHLLRADFNRFLLIVGGAAMSLVALVWLVRPSDHRAAPADRSGAAESRSTHHPSEED